MNKSSKKYKGIVIKNSSMDPYPSGDAQKSSRRSVLGVGTHGAGVVGGKISGAKNGLQAVEAKSRSKGRGVGSQKLEHTEQESAAKTLSELTPERKVDNRSLKITMKGCRNTNKSKEVSGVYINNQLVEIRSNFKRVK